MAYIVSAGEAIEIPIPGLTYNTPYGEVGVVVSAVIGGNVDQLSLAITVDLCVPFVGCASDVFPTNTAFPVTILEGTFTFGDYCSSTENPAAQIATA